MFGTDINNKGKQEKNKKVKAGPCIFPFKYTHVTLFQRNTDVIRFFRLGDQFVES